MVTERLAEPEPVSDHAADQPQPDHADQLIVVASPERPRRRDDILPEHESRFPLTPVCAALVRERYDGTYSTCREIGQALRSPAGETYPSWRIEQIASVLGLAETARDELIARSRAQEASGKDQRKHPLGPLSPLQPARPTARQPARQRTPEHAPVHDIQEAIAVVSNGPATAIRTLLREDLLALANQTEEPAVQPE